MKAILGIESLFCLRGLYITDCIFHSLQFTTRVVILKTTLKNLRE